jgi:uncharacterized protein (DUF58 family)
MAPNARGVGATLAGAALIAGGFAFGYPELVVLGVVALVATCCAVGYAVWRPTLSVTRTVEPDRVTRGEPCTQELTVHNGSRLRSATLIAEDLCAGERVPVPLIRLRPGHDTTVSYPVPTARRGVVTVGPLTVTRRDPLGLLGASRTHGGTAKVWVHPRTHPIVAVPVGVARSLDGRVDRVPHGSITFDTLREYVLGDELRRVHWRTSARVGELMVREYVDTSLPRIVVLLDDRAASWARTSPGRHARPSTEDSPDTFEEACEAAASVVVAAVREDLAVELVLVSDARVVGTGDHRAVGPGGARRADQRPLLDRLAEAEPVPGDRGIDQVLAQLRHDLLGDTLVHLTGTGAVEDLAQIGALRGRYPTIVAGVFGDPEPVPSTVEGVLVLAVGDATGFAAAWDGIGRW